jgi:hypothetical protein
MSTPKLKGSFTDILEFTGARFLKYFLILKKLNFSKFLFRP